jgi:CRISPR-associated protein Csx17
MSEQGEVDSCEVDLAGCRAEPLASYLKALGVLRLVASQRDKNAKGFWRGEHFVIRSSLNRDALVQFFCGEWEPTPVVAPWNGGSGFYPKDNREASDAILASDASRLRAFAMTIRLARSFVAAHGWKERPSDEIKLFLISAMRAVLPDVALAWLDAALVIGEDRLLFPPLLGTGGNDGRLDFSSNFQQRVVEVIASKSPALLESSLFGAITTTRFEGTMGQYQPAAGRRTNPWDFVLLIEGALVFAAAATRRYESSAPAAMAFPFHARAAGGLSTLTDSDEDESRDELWLPLWSAPTTLRELRHLFAEGRATVGSGSCARTASTALDFARAVSALGVDRGIESFARVGFHVRNGLAYFATPLGRFPTREVPSARLLDDVDGWFERFRRKASGAAVPARVGLARRRLEQAMFDASRTGALGSVLIGLADAELALGRSLTFSANAFLAPVPRLSRSWAAAVVDGSVEQRLGAALAARGRMRERLVPLASTGRFGRADQPQFVFAERPLVDNLHALLLREDVEELQGRPRPKVSTGKRCSLADIAAFIRGAVDDGLIERWLRSAVLVEGGLTPEAPRAGLLPPAAFAVLSLVHGRLLGNEEIPRTESVLPRACAGDAPGATTAAIRRLNAVGRQLPVRALFETPACTRRIAAALAFPLTFEQRCILESMVLPRDGKATPEDSIVSVEEQV